jgi:hypothetical protein
MDENVKFMLAVAREESCESREMKAQFLLASVYLQKAKKNKS